MLPGNRDGQLTRGQLRAWRMAVVGQRLLLCAMLLTVVGAACSGGESRVKQWSSPPTMRIDANKQYTATIATTVGTEEGVRLGEIEVTLLVKEAPTTVNNFVFLAREGFYDGLMFHRIMKGFMVQTGDPKGDGSGGPGYRFIDEPVASNYDRGVLAMANAGPNTNGSQFFIVHGEGVAAQLPKSYTIFGRVTRGIEVLDQIASVAVSANARGEVSVPQRDARMTKVTIREQ